MKFLRIFKVDENVSFLRMRQRTQRGPERGAACCQSFSADHVRKVYSMKTAVQRAGEWKHSSSVQHAAIAPSQTGEREWKTNSSPLDLVSRKRETHREDRCEEFPRSVLSDRETGEKTARCAVIVALARRLRALVCLTLVSSEFFARHPTTESYEAIHCLGPPLKRAGRIPG